MIRAARAELLQGCDGALAALASGTATAQALTAIGHMLTAKSHTTKARGLRAYNCLMKAGCLFLRDANGVVRTMLEADAARTPAKASSRTGAGLTGLGKAPLEGDELAAIMDREAGLRVTGS